MTTRSDDHRETPPDSAHRPAKLVPACEGGHHDGYGRARVGRVTLPAPVGIELDTGELKQYLD
ncbi:hypothetical protein ACWER6_03785 [Streptomyces sp. NPDC004009]